MTFAGCQQCPPPQGAPLAQLPCGGLPTDPEPQGEHMPLAGGVCLALVSRGSDFRPLHIYAHSHTCAAEDRGCGEE